MNQQKLKIISGFTLIEILVGIFVFAIIAVGVIALVSNVFTSSSRQSTLLSDQDQARKVVFGVINQLRNAQTSATGAYPLQSASAQSVIFYSNVDSDSLVERVRYFVQNGQLYQGIIKPSGNPLSYNPASEKVTMVQNNLANGSGPVFYYYNSDYDGTTDSYLPDPVNVTDVKFIKLALKIFNKGGVVNANAYTVTAEGEMRNLKTNLGQGPQGINVIWTLTTQVSPSGSGSVAVSPVGPTYADASLVNINAYPILGYGFSGWSGNVTDQSSQATTIVMNDNNTVTANFTAIPQTMTGSVSSKSGSASARKWTLKINNNNSFTVSSVSLYSFSLVQTSGSSCSPVVTDPAQFPALAGNIAANSYRSYVVTINFGSCAASAKFTANFSFAGNNGAVWGSASVTGQTQ